MEQYHCFLGNHRTRCRWLRGDKSRVVYLLDMDIYIPYVSATLGIYLMYNNGSAL